MFVIGDKLNMILSVFICNNHDNVYNASVSLSILNRYKGEQNHPQKPEG